MGNLITNKSIGQEDHLNISNGSMSVLISSLALSGSYLAKNENEIEFMTWIVSRDQGILGMGTVGFDLQDMPWSENEAIFNKQKAFLLSVIQRVKSGVDLNALRYKPKFLQQNIEAFEKMISSFLYSHIKKENTLVWMPPKEKQLKCEEHGVFLHEHGCVVCNDK